MGEDKRHKGGREALQAHAYGVWVAMMVRDDGARRGGDDVAEASRLGYERRHIRGDRDGMYANDRSDLPAFNV